MLESLECLGYSGFAITRDGRIWSMSRNRWLSQCPDQRGYLLVNLNKFGTKRVHVLVAKMFIPNPENKSQVNHINGIKTDNRVENLEWMTNLENAIHAEYRGLMPHNVFTEADVRFICEELENGISCSELSNMYGFSYDALFQIKRGENWKHISKDYNFDRPRKYNKRLSEEAVREICMCLINKIPVTVIADKFKTSCDVISKIKSGKNFRFISKDYF